MRVAVVDQGFVLASPERVFALVRDPAGYEEWWPGVRSEPGGEVRFPVLGTVSVETSGVRENVEIFIRVAGKAARGHLQWYLESFREGTIVYGITNVQPTRGWSARKVLRHRTSMRDALIALRELQA